MEKNAFYFFHDKNQSAYSMTNYEETLNRAYLGGRMLSFTLYRSITKIKFISNQF